MAFYSKQNLYKEIERLKFKMGFDYGEYNIDLLSYYREKISIEELNFTTKKLRGMAVIGDTPTDDIVLLNKNRSKTEQTFDFGHEVMHLVLHRNIQLKTFNCLDDPSIKQDSYLEWQANEGAAEFFVPYKALLPIFKNNYDCLDTWMGINMLKLELAQTFNVSLGVIHYRIESLRYEIDQYINGVSIDDINILSQTQQARRKIKVQSINDKENILFQNDMLSYYLN